MTAPSTSVETKPQHKKSKFPNEIYLLFCAIIWGFGFIAQRLGNQHIGPFTFNAIRFLLGALTVLPLLLFVRKREKLASVEQDKRDTKKTQYAWLWGSLLCGLALFAGASFQQVGLIGTDAGKAGFITALYIVLVPLIGLLFGKRVSINVWVALAIAVGGLYLLMVNEGMSIAKSDLVIFFGAFLWALHILSVDHFTETVNGIRLAFGQFLVAGLLAAIVALNREPIALEAIQNALFPLLFSGIVVAGIAFTFQVLGQRDTNPTIAALIMSLEAVFAVIGGILFLQETMSVQEWLGCVLMLIAVMLTQIPASWLPHRRAPGH